MTPDPINIDCEDAAATIELIEALADFPLADRTFIADTLLKRSKIDPPTYARMIAGD